MKVIYELFCDLHTGSEYRVTTNLTHDKDKNTWSLYWHYSAMYTDNRVTEDLEIDEEIALKMLKDIHISSVEVVKDFT